MNTHSRSLFAAASLSLLALLVGTSLAVGSPTPSASPPQCGRMLFARHCAPCHGATGLGDGLGADTLDPKPRDFSTGRFRMVSTLNEVPTTQDLFDVITNGIVGSAMPPHEHMPRGQRLRLAEYVQSLTRARRAEVLQALAVEDDEELPWQQALADATVAPGELVELPSPVARTPELLIEGRELFVKNCASCHDLDGTGRTRDDMVDEKGRPSFARDLTAGILKGGTELVDIHRRIRCGMPGSPMPSFDLLDREAWALTYYVESLIRPGARELVTQEHTTFTPQRITGTLSADPSASVWNQVEARWVPMAPLQWTDERVPGAMVQVARDERMLGFRLVWEDASPKENGTSMTPDTALIRFSPVAVPQFFSPGRAGETTEYWEWSSDSGDFLYAPLGMQVRGRHERGFYELVFLRALDETPERVGMGKSGVSIAFEIRNGAAGDPDRSQNITVWHRLTR